MKNHNKPEALQLKSSTGLAQGVAQPPDKPQKKGIFTQNSCCEHPPITASASGTWVRAATGAGLNKQSHQHQLKNQAAVLPAQQVLTWLCEGTLTSNHKPGCLPTISSQLLTGRRAADFGLQHLSERKPRSTDSLSCCFIFNLTSGDRNRAPDVQTGNTRRDPAKEES